MASSTINTEKIPITKYEEKPVSVTLELSIKEAQFIKMLVGSVGLTGEFRTFADFIYDGLDEVESARVIIEGTKKLCVDALVNAGTLEIAWPA